MLCYTEREKVNKCGQETKIYKHIWTSVHVEGLYMHIFTHKLVNKGQLPPEGYTQRAKLPFVIAGEESYIRESNRGKTETKTERNSEVTLPCPQHQGKSLTPRLIKHWKWDQEAFPFRLINQLQSSKQFSTHLRVQNNCLSMQIKNQIMQ